MEDAMNDVAAMLVAALNNDTGLTAQIGASAVFDAPPKSAAPPYVAIFRHDALARNADDTPGADHRLVLHVWIDHSSRTTALNIAARVSAVALGANLSGAGTTVTNRVHQRTETGIDRRNGWTRAAVYLRLFSEPV
jgi:uncharacterized protein DUF3168